MTNTRLQLVAGLGNPGRQYERTRHNIGFMVIDELVRRLPDGAARRRFDAELLESSTTGGRLILLKPQTYMNRSGTAVSQAMRWYKVRLEDLLVVCDDLDLPFGRLRLRPQGSSGGHNGLKSIIEQIGSDRFPRLRVGVGRPIRGDAVAHVLNRFSPDEEAALPAIIERAADAVMTWHAEGITAAMNQFNQPPASRPSAT